MRNSSRSSFDRSGVFRFLRTDVNCRLTYAGRKGRSIFLEGRTMVPMDGTAAKRFCDKLAAVNPLGSVVANDERKEVRI